LESFGDGTLQTRLNTAPAASKCYNRPNDADSWRNHKNTFAMIFPFKSKAQLLDGPIVGICLAAEEIAEEFQCTMRDLNNRVGMIQAYPGVSDSTL
jgi:hypothetical protein